MIKKQIDLKDLHSIIFLEKGHYDIWILGGFGLQLKDFHIKIVDSENRIIQIKENEKFYYSIHCIWIFVFCM